MRAKRLRMLGKDFKTVGHGPFASCTGSHYVPITYDIGVVPECHLLYFRY